MTSEVRDDHSSGEVEVVVGSRLAQLTDGHLMGDRSSGPLVEVVLDGHTSRGRDEVPGVALAAQLVELLEDLASGVT